MKQDVGLSLAEHEDAIRERLKTIVKQSSQAEIERKTGVSNQNIGRYLKGVKAPASFCSKLIEGLDVNPAWLMVGEGSPMLSDVNSGTSQMAGDLLELVEAMSSVSQMKLGALTGKEHLHVLRKLNQALLQYETLRERLNKHSKPIFQQLIDNIAAAISYHERDKTDSMIKACEQVRRLCDDPELDLKYDRVKAAHLYRSGNFEETVEIQRQIAFKCMVRGKTDEQTCIECHNLAMALHGLLHIEEALSICDACIALVGARGEKWPHYHRLLALGGLLDVDTGNMKRGRERLFHAFPRVEEASSSAHITNMFTYMSFASGTTTIDKVMASSLPEAPFLAPFTFWLENPKHLRTMIEITQTGKRRIGDFPTLIEFYANTLLSAIDGKKPAAARLPKELREAQRHHAYRRLSEYIIFTQADRLAGDKARARRSLLQAEATLNKSAPDVTPIFLYRAMHFRNALELIEASTRSNELAALRAKALAFFKEHLKAGYGCFQGVLKE